jgi:CHASE2 domain
MASPQTSRGRIGGVIHRARRPDRAQLDALKQGVPFWFVAAVLFGFAVLQIMLNPFGFSDLTQRYAQDISNLLITGPYLYGTEGRDRVSVALIDEGTLQTLHMPWQWSLGDHARVLDAIRDEKPKAVVVDFLFVDQRPDPTSKQMIEEIARYRKDNIPLYFEGGIELPYGEAALRPELAATGVRILDPTIPVYNGVARQYNVTGACFGARPKPDGTCYSLALQVFADTYPKETLAPLNGMMELVWGTRTDPINAKWMTRSDASGKRRSCADEIAPLTRIYLAFFDTSAVQNPCPYTGVVPVVPLMEGSDDPDIAKLIAGRIVFYGGSLEGAQDKTYTPVNGLLPSVFVHAMALDNLITFHGRPQQNVMTVAGTTISNNPAQILAIVPVILVLSWLHMRRIRRRRRKPQQGSRDANATLEYVFDKTIQTVWHWLAFALALGIGLLLTLASGLSVANWVEVVFVSVALAAMLLVGVPDSIWGYLHHVAGGTPPQEGA